MYSATLVTVLVLFLVFAQLSAAPTNSLYCKDEHGNDVDWYIVYKLPKVKTRGSPHSDGHGYAYIVGEPINAGAGSKSAGWTVSSKKVTDPSSIFNNTLALGYKNSNQYSYVMYNDHPAEDKPNTYRAHAKGVLAMDASKGFWLTHSIPRFPLRFSGNQNSVYPDSGANYGQTALCVSFSTQQVASQIIQHLTLAKPNIYDSNVAKNVLKDSTALQDLITSRKSAAEGAAITFSTIKGNTFTAYSIAKKQELDIYSAIIAPALKSNLLVETWRNGEGKPLASDCSGSYRVQNINKVALPVNPTEINWLASQDHSKWAVTDNGQNPVVCIGDINRMESQFKRGGGVVCMNNKVVWKAFRDAAEQVEACPSG